MMRLIYTSLLFLLSHTIIFGQQQITILHTNDMHAHFESTRSTRNPDIIYGGLLALNYYVQAAAHETNDNYLLFDSGDFMTGTPISDIEYSDVKGGALPHFMNYIGYDGLTPGNHEFDVSVQNCIGLIKMCDFPVFSSNLFFSDGRLFTKEAYHIYEKNGVKVGVIGAIVHELGGYLNSAQQSQVYSKPAAGIIDSIATIIDPLTDLIVVLSHSGIEIDREIAATTGRHIDVIIGGHSHTQLNEPEVVNHKLIVQAGSNCRNLGRLDVAVVADTIQSYNGRLIFLDATHIEPDTALANQIQDFSNQIAAMYGVVIGELVDRWSRDSNSESNIGDFITDCIKDAAEADFAVLNSGGIRQDLSAGPIRALDIKNIVPFNNQICTFEMSGADILKMVQTNANSALAGDFGILQVSGLSYQWTRSSAGKAHIADVKVNNKPLEIQKQYKGATVDYVLANADKYFQNNSLQFTNTYMPLSDVVIKAIKELKTIHSTIDDRIKQIE